MKKSLFFLFPLLIAASSNEGGCGDKEPPITNWSFDRWTDGSTIEAWEAERGSIERVPTWHEADRGVRFLGDDVLISQVGTGSDSCTRFDFTVFVEPGVEARFNIDYGNDGTNEVSLLFPAGEWIAVRQDVVAPPDDDVPVRYQLSKVGGGQLQIGTARGRVAHDCDGERVYLPTKATRAFGEACVFDGECDEGICTKGTCGADPAACVWFCPNKN